MAQSAMPPAGSTMQQGGYDHLESGPVLKTATRLQQRIAARHADRNLAKVATELVDIIGEVGDSSRTNGGRLRTARTMSRALTVVAVGAVTVALVFTIKDAIGDNDLHSSFDWLTVLQTIIQDLIYAAIAVFFLYGLPDRLVRSHSLRQLHRLRSLAHVIDMHQLDKDPERLRKNFEETEATIRVNLNRAQLESYLDYCSELLALVGKAAALCAEDTQDPVILETVSTIETLTTGMSRKIWQKISLLPRE